MLIRCTGEILLSSRKTRFLNKGYIIIKPDDLLNLTFEQRPMTILNGNRQCIRFACGRLEIPDDMQFKFKDLQEHILGMLFASGTEVIALSLTDKSSGESITWQKPTFRRKHDIKR